MTTERQDGTGPDRPLLAEIPQSANFVSLIEIRGSAVNSVRAVDRAISILFDVAGSDEPLGLTEISRSTDIDKATALRLLFTLEESGLVRRDPQTRKYMVGPGVWRLTSAWRSDLRSVSQRHLEELRQATEESVSLVCPRGLDRVVILALDALHELCVVPAVGNAVPIYAGASGRVIMAFMRPEERDKIIEITRLKAVNPHKIIDKRAFLQSLETVRYTGYATSIGEVTLGSSAIAAPIFDSTGQVTAVVSLRGPEVRMTQERMTQMAPLVVEAAMAISRDIGYAPKEAKSA
jgi:IclR family KDG regulon transcriptional repressor